MRWFRQRQWADIPRTSRRRFAYRPHLEMLESRTVPTTIHWINVNGGSWHVPANWDLGRVPGVGDDVVIDAPGNYTVTYSSGQSEIKSLTSTQAFSLTGGGLGVQGVVEVAGAFQISGAELREATVASDTTLMAGNNRTILTDVTLNGNLESASGDVILQGSWKNNGVITLSGGYLALGGTYTTAGMGDIQAQGGEVDLTGVLDNHGNTLTLNGTNVFWDLGGTIQGGVLRTLGNTLFAGGTSCKLSDVVIHGTVQVRENSYLTLDGSFRNQGVITLDAFGALAFTGSYTTAAIGEIHNVQGKVYLGGTLNNVGSVLALNSVTGSWGLLGTVNGGTIATSNGTALFVAGSQGPTLVGVTINGEFDAPDQVQVQNGLTVNGILRVNSGSSTGKVQFLGPQIVDGTGSIIFDGYGGRLTAAPENPVILGPGITVHTTLMGQLDNVVNQGTILIDNPSANLTISGDGWRNEGRIRLTAGLLTLDGTYTPAALGNWQRTGGDLALKGVLLNQGNTLALSAATGSLRLVGGRVVGGTITGRDGATVVLSPFFGGTLTDVTLQTDITIPSNTTLSLAGAWRNQGTLILSGGNLYVSDTFSRSALGTFHRTSGAIQLRGTVNNYGSIITLDDTTGPLVLHGGTIAGGTVMTVGGAGLYVTDVGNHLHGVTIDGNLDVSPSPYSYSPTNVDITGGLILQGTLTVDYPGAFAQVSFQGSQTVSGAGTVVLGHNGLFGGVGGVVTLGPGITVRGQGTLHDFLNQGTLELDQPGDDFDFSGASWKNAGVIQMRNGTLNLGGTFSTADLGDLRRSGGIVNLTGNLRNQGTTLHLDAGAGSWNLLGGTIAGGTVATDPGVALVPTNRGGTLSGVQLQTDLMIGTGTSVSLTGPWSNRGTITLAGGTLDLGGTFTWGALGTLHRSGGTLRVSGTVINNGQTITVNASTGSVELAGGTIDGGTVVTADNVSLMANNGRLDGVTINGQVTGTVFATHGLTVNGTLQGTIYFQGSQILDGTGTISLGTGSSSGSFYGQTGELVTIGPNITVNGWGSLWNFRNLGTMVLDRPGQFFYFGGEWHNQGLIHLVSGTLRLDGTFQTADATSIVRDSGTSVSLIGTLDNRGTTLTLNNSTGSWELAGGTIQGGTVAATGGANLAITAGTLDSVTLTADVAVSGSGFLSLAGSWSNLGRLTLYGGNLNLGGTFTMAQLGDFHQYGGTVSITGTLDNTGHTLALDGPTGSWQLAGGTIVGGTISTAPGVALVVSPGRSVSSRLQGVTVNGNLQVSRTDLTVMGGMTLNGTMTLGDAIYGSNNYGTATFNGSQTVDGTGVIVLTNQFNFTSILQGASGRVTFGPGITIQANKGRLINFINQGTIVVDATDQFVSLGGTWQNVGSLQQTSGTLFLDGTFTLDDLGDYRRNGGTVALAGTLDNTGRTFSLDLVPDLSFTLNATIRGGVVASAPGYDTLRGAGTLDGTTLSGDLKVAGQFTLAGNWSNRGSLTLSTGTLTLGGTWSPDALGDFNNLGGTVRLVGILDLMGQTLTLNHRTGSWVLAGGTILGGTLTTTRRTRFIIPANAQTRLDHVTLNGTLEVQSPGQRFQNPGLIVTNGLTVNGTLLVDGPVLFDGPQTLDGTGTVRLQYYQLNQTTLGAAGGVVTFGPNLTVLAEQGNLANFLNQGTIVVTGGPLSFLALEGTNWRNGGIIQVSAGTLALRGTFAGSGLGDIRNLNGLVAIQGTLNNTSLALTDVTGSWELDGGTITGGTVSTSGGARLLITANGGTLNGVTINTDLEVLSGARLFLTGNWSNRGTLTLQDGTLNLGGHVSTPDLGDLRFLAGSVIFSGQLNNQGQTLLLQGPAVTWHLAGGTITGGTLTIIGGPLIVESSTQIGGFQNLILNGDLTIIDTSVAGSSFTLNGTMTLGRVGGYGAYLGSLDGAATVLFRGTDAARTALTALYSTTLTYGPSVVIDGGSGCIGFCPSWSGTGVAIGVVNQGTIRAQDAGQTLTIRASDLVNLGTWQATAGGILELELVGAAGNLVNAGLVQVDVDSTLSANTTLTQIAGQIILAGGTLAAPLVSLEGGVLLGTGTVTGDLVNDAVVQVGFPGVTGILEVQGNYTQGAAGDLVVQIGGRDAGTGYDILSVGGTATLDGTLDVQILDGFFAEPGDTFTILTFADHAGDFAAINGLYPDGDVYFDPQYDATGLTLVAIPY